MGQLLGTAYLQAATAASWPRTCGSLHILWRPVGRQHVHGGGTKADVGLWWAMGTVLSLASLVTV